MRPKQPHAFVTGFSSFHWSGLALVFFLAALGLALFSCSPEPPAVQPVRFKEGIISTGDPDRAWDPPVPTFKVRINNVARNAAEVSARRPLTLKLSGRIRLALGSVHGGSGTVTFTLAGGPKTETVTVSPDQGWVEVDLTLPGGVEALTVSSDAAAGAYLASPRAVTAGAYRLAALLVIDALRADALGAYGAKGTSPNLDRFAAGSAVFRQAHTASAFTLTSTASTLTGLWPWQHGVIFSPDAGLALSAEVPTLVQGFRDAGYHTAAFSGTYFSFADNGFGSGFELMDESCAGKFFAESADCLAGRVRGFLEGHADEPVFIYVHFVDPHSPYWPPEPFRSRFTAGLARPGDQDTARGDTNQFEESRKLWQLFRHPSPKDLAWLWGLYRGEVAYVDDRLGPVLEFIRDRCAGPGPGGGNAIVRALRDYESGQLRDPSPAPEPVCSVALSADHGEAFFEHGTMGHIADFFQPVMRVPLILYGRGVPPGTESDYPARTIDLLPTLLDSSGLDLPAGIPGRTLLAGLHGAGSPEPAAGLHFVRGRKEYALVRWPRKILFLPDRNLLRLYDLEADPGETKDLSGRDPETARELVGELQRQLDLPVMGRGRRFDPDTLRRLKNLGYINQ